MGLFAIQRLKPGFKDNLYNPPAWEHVERFVNYCTNEAVSPFLIVVLDQLCSVCE